MYTYRVTTDDGVIIAWIDDNGIPMIEQPHHPAANLAIDPLWKSIKEAQEWASAYVDEINNAPKPGVKEE